MYSIRYTIGKLSWCDCWQAVHMSMPVGVFDLPSTLPEDPILRKQCLEDLMKTFHSSFSFIQVGCRPKVWSIQVCLGLQLSISNHPSAFSGFSSGWCGVPHEQPLETEETTVWIFLFSVYVDTSFEALWIHRIVKIYHISVANWQTDGDL